MLDPTQTSDVLIPDWKGLGIFFLPSSTLAHHATATIAAGAHQGAMTRPTMAATVASSSTLGAKYSMQASKATLPSGRMY